MNTNPIIKSSAKAAKRTDHNILWHKKTKSTRKYQSEQWEMRLICHGAWLTCCGNRKAKTLYDHRWMANLRKRHNDRSGEEKIKITEKNSQTLTRATNWIYLRPVSRGDSVLMIPSNRSRFRSRSRTRIRTISFPFSIIIMHDAWSLKWTHLAGNYGLTASKLGLYWVAPNRILRQKRFDIFSAPEF